MNFERFAASIAKQIDTMAKNHDLFVVDADRDSIYQRYLSAFPEGTNPIFKERTEHDCNTCKNFIRDVGHVVAIVNGEYITVWDVTDPDYQPIADAMAEYVRSLPIQTVFLHYQAKVGNHHNSVMMNDKPLTFNHFNAVLPNKFVSADRDSIRSQARASRDVLQRGLETLTDSAIETVLELIDQNSLYRGAENRNAVAMFKDLKDKYQKLENDFQRQMFAWVHYKSPAARIRNTAIGTLLVDISEGRDLTEAVMSFESKVDATNYKRTTAVITKGMVEQALKTIRELDIEDALPRRFAHLGDITVNNVLFVDRSASAVMKDPLKDMLMADVKPASPQSFDKVEEISIEDFIANVVPKSQSIELIMENRHKSNLMSLIAPVNQAAHNILQWDNNFSWSYNGNVTDSIKERVKAAGGNIDAWLRVSLSWFNYDDLDLHIIEPNGNEIYFGNRGRRHPSSGMLDVDMNAGGYPSREAVENITYNDPSKMPNGVYQVVVHNYCKRESIDVGFQIQTEYNGEISTIEYPSAVPNGQRIVIMSFTFDGKEVKFSSQGQKSVKSQDIWGIKTNVPIKVQAISLSPNHWDGQEKGNKHYFFFLEGCKNDEPTRGLYNEFLSNKLTPHRKVFEVLGDRMKCQPSDEQLSGLGFSSTKRDEVTVKVSGEFTRMLKIKF